MQIYLTTLGCRLNEAELEQWSFSFQAAGHRLVAPEEAEVMVFNTCAVTSEAVRKSRQQLRRLQRCHPSAKLVLTGCYATLNPEEATELGVDLVVDNRDKDRLVTLTEQAVGVPTMPVAAAVPGASSLFARHRTRAFIKIQDGCRYRCTYCIVTKARGEEKSRSSSQIITEINALVAQGVQEAVLTGVHMGGYGADLGTDLYSLVQAILQQTALPRLRLSSLEPWDLPWHFFELFENPRLMPHLHLPLQSGSDTVLRRMARRCKSNCFSQLIAKARAQVADITISTDIIVGFPGESETEWQETVAFVENMHFGHLHIFPYSARKDTKAAELPLQRSEKLKKQRARQLHNLAKAHKQATLERYLTRQFKVLFEGKGKPTKENRQRHWGYTPNYLRVMVETDQNISLENKLLPVRFFGVENDHLLGQVDLA